MASLVIKDAEICFKNFRGKESTFNPAGKRNFWVRIDGRKAKKLKKEGWAIKEMYLNKSRTKRRWYLPVTIYESWADTKINSKVVAIMSDGVGLKVCKQLKDHSMGLLDIVDIEHSNMVIRGYEYDVNGRHGIKAYLRNADVYIPDSISTVKIINFLEGI